MKVSNGVSGPILLTLMVAFITFVVVSFVAYVSGVFKDPQTYDQCMISKMYNRPSSMHEIVSEYCKRETL